MIKFKDENSIPVKMWLNEIEDGAMAQIKNLANLPFAFKHIAIMPDSHQGYGMPIGGVLATRQVIIPNAVGVDIGCGMCAVKTSLTELDTETLKKIMGEIRQVIPVGFNKHQEKQEISLMPDRCNGESYEKEIGGELAHIPNYRIISQEYPNALKSLGTLGGCNDFIEIQKGNDGHIWIMIHSGSRNLGKQVAAHYNKIAKDLNEKWHSSVPKEYDLAFLPLDSEEGQAYIREMNYCVDFALANRKLMMERVKNIFSKVLEVSTDLNCDDDETWKEYSKRVDWLLFKPMINIAHNYATMENHFGQNVMIHRKGATLASDKTIGIIPGSQGTKSYIVKGLGNQESFNSCSHGAGRKMGRKEAQRTLNLEEEVSKLNKLGVIHAIRNEKDLDEAPGSYKDIDEVMSNQKDLVKVLVELTPLAVVKG
jgi:tRNA-splicing ligase RtcB